MDETARCEASSIPKWTEAQRFAVDARRTLHDEGEQGKPRTVRSAARLKLEHGVVTIRGSHEAFVARPSAIVSHVLGMKAEIEAAVTGQARVEGRHGEVVVRQIVADVGGEWRERHRPRPPNSREQQILIARLWLGLVAVGMAHADRATENVRQRFRMFPQRSGESDQGAPGQALG
jgi:hypothetical protein